MIKKLEREAIRADLAAIQGLIDLRTEDEDPVGWAQLSYRKQSLEGQLAELAASPAQRSSVGLFFGGRPVVGSRGIAVDFGTAAVENFQALVSTRFASLEGALGERGPLPQRDRTQMIITDVARGSFGFILEELGTGDQPSEASLGGVMDEVCDLIYRVSAINEENFSGAAESVDSRLLTSLKNFFKHMDEAGATLRLVADEREFHLPTEAISRARERTESLEVSEGVEEVSGRLYVLPDAKRFELYPVGGNPPIRGAIAPECMRQIADEGVPVAEGIAGSIRVVRLRVREIRSQRQAARKNYSLLHVSPMPSSDS